MRSRRRWLAVAVPAALAALVAGAVLAGAAPAPASHVNRAAALQLNHVRIVQRGLVRDCEYIDAGGIQIEGEGVNNPVAMEFPPASCFNLYNKFTITIVSPLTGNDVMATGYEYQNLAGHCLWDNNGTIDMGEACAAGHTREMFYGIPGSQSAYGGWLFSSVYGGEDVYMASPGCDPGSDVIMTATVYACDTWNFPQS